MVPHDNKEVNMKVVSVDNILGLFPEDVAVEAEGLMNGAWDPNGLLVGYQVFFRILGAYGKLGLDTDCPLLKQDDLVELLNNDNIYVAAA
jgi:hypothetical protein